MIDKCIRYYMKLVVGIFTIVLLLGSMVLSLKGEDIKKEITILFTHDLHSNIEVGLEEVDGEYEEIGGFAKIKTVIDRVVEEEERVLVVDGGDFSMGTLYQTMYQEQALELRLLGKMGVDVTTLGNHEFDYTDSGLIAMLDAAKESNDPVPQIVISNINWEKSKGDYVAGLKDAMDNFGVMPYKVMEKEGLRIGVFGLMGDDAVACAPTSNLIFDPIIESANKTVKFLKEEEKVDLVLCLSHSGTNLEDKDKSEDELLAKAVSGIDIIVSGHTHSSLEEPIQIGDTYVVSAGEYGKNIGKITMEQNETKRYNVKDYELIKIDEEIEEDGEVVEAINYYRSYLDEYVQQYGYKNQDQVLAYNPYEFASIEEMQVVHDEQPLGNLIADSYIYAVQQAEGERYEAIDVAITPVGVIRDHFQVGEIKVSDVYRVSSLGTGPDQLSGYPLCSVYLTGKELKILGEIEASVSRLMSAAQLYMSGLQVTFNPNRLFLNRVTDVKLIRKDGLVEIEDEKLYRVVGGLYSAQMMSAVEGQSKGLLKVRPKFADGTLIDDYSKTVIPGLNGEIKEWYALATYLESFDKVNQLSVIPEQYASTMDRKVIENSKSIMDLLKNPNKFFFMLIAAIAVVILICTTLIIFIRKKYLKLKR